MDWLHAPVLLMVVAMPKDAVNAHPAFKTLPEAVAFISGCLDANDPKKLGLAAIHKVTAFDSLQQAHRQVPLTQRYAGCQFPANANQFKLGGHASELGHVHIDFIKQKDAWYLDSIWLCR
ncbi:MAG TPA: hypothetical protein PKL14_01995 [Holophaga sp.]|nr:hypothetical protein [Holophaga sp.]